MPSGHAIVDGSNIATEGRSEPSLQQLDEAVTQFIAEYDFERVTVIVDASFEHRVAKSERPAARQAIDDNEIITPPAGVIGRGDTFILQVADRANAVVLSNDSFQEFHGTHEWLFDEGRLIGGKPIPGVGWVYVPRAPVRGPVSRRARAQADEADTPPSKAPTNATGYSFEFNFYSFEYPEFVCASFNDQFIALVQPPPMGSVNGNICFDSQSNPVSVNIAFFDVCLGCPLGETELIGTGFDTWDDAGATSYDAC